MSRPQRREQAKRHQKVVTWPLPCNSHHCAPRFRPRPALVPPVPQGMSTACTLSPTSVAPVLQIRKQWPHMRCMSAMCPLHLPQCPAWQQSLTILMTRQVGGGRCDCQRPTLLPTRLGCGWFVVFASARSLARARARVCVHACSAGPSALILTCALAQISSHSSSPSRLLPQVCRSFTTTFPGAIVPSSIRCPKPPPEGRQAICRLTAASCCLSDTHLFTGRQTLLSPS